MRNMRGCWRACWVDHGGDYHRRKLIMYAHDRDHHFHQILLLLICNTFWKVPAVAAFDICNRSSLEGASRSSK